MAGKPATLPAGIRLADYLSTGLLARICTPDDVSLALEATGRQSKRQRDLPAHAVAYYVMALSLYRGVNYQEVNNWGQTQCCSLKIVTRVSSPHVDNVGRASRWQANQRHYRRASDLLII